MPDTSAKPRICVECGRAVTGQGRVLYCSEACALIDRRCPTCNAVFRVQRKRRNRPGYCSLACRPPKPLRPRISSPCVGCGATISRLECQRADGRGQFCSRSCAAIHRPIRNAQSRIAAGALLLVTDAVRIPCVAELRVGQWSVDLAFPLQMVALELDGEYWHSLPAMVDRDRRKDEWLTAHGWTVVRVVIRKRDTTHDVFENVLEALTPWLHSNTP